MRKFWNHVAKFVSGNSVALNKSGYYLYDAASSGTKNIVNSSEIGNNPQDEQIFQVDHGGGDLAILTLLCQGADRLYEPSITGAVQQAFVSGNNAYLLTGQTRTSIQLTKGDSVKLMVHGRLWFWQIVRSYLRSFAIPSGTLTYQIKPYDNLILFDTTGGAQNATLPPIATMLINGESREIEAKFVTMGASNNATLTASSGETIEGASSISMLTANDKRRLRPINSTTWGIF